MWIYNSNYYYSDGNTYGYKPCVSIYMPHVTTSFVQKYWMTGRDAVQSYAKKSSDGKTLYWYAGSGSDASDSLEQGVWYFLGIA